MPSVTGTTGPYIGRTGTGAGNVTGFPPSGPFGPVEGSIINTDLLFFQNVLKFDVKIKKVERWLYMDETHNVLEGSKELFSALPRPQAVRFSYSIPSKIAFYFFD